MPGSVWDLRQKSVARHIDTSSVVTSIEVGAEGRHITTAGGSEVQIWDGDSLTPTASFPMLHPVETASYCPAKQRFAAGGEDMGVYLYSAENGQELDSSRGIATAAGENYILLLLFASLHRCSSAKSFLTHAQWPHMDRGLKAPSEELLHRSCSEWS